MNTATSCRVKIVIQGILHQRPLTRIHRQTCVEATRDFGSCFSRTVFLLSFLFFCSDLFPEGECFYLWSEGLLLCHSGIPQIRIKHSKVFQDLRLQNSVGLLNVALSGVQPRWVNSHSGDVCFHACLEASNASR